MISSIRPHAVNILPARVVKLVVLAMLIMAVLLMASPYVLSGDVNLTGVVVQDVDGVNVVVDLVEYATAFPPEEAADWNHPLWNYLKGEKESPVIIALETSDQRFICLISYAESFRGDSGEAIAAATNVSSSDFNSYKRFVGFDEEGEAILEDVDQDDGLIYSLTFEVIDEKSAFLEGAEVLVEGQGSKKTGSEGRVVFEDLEPGLYSYEVSKTGYEDQGGAVSIEDGDLLEPVTLIKSLDDLEIEPAVVREKADFTQVFVLSLTKDQFAANISAEEISLAGDFSNLRIDELTLVDPSQLELELSGVALQHKTGTGTIEVAEEGLVSGRTLVGEVKVSPINLRVLKTFPADGATGVGISPEVIVEFAQQIRIKDSTEIIFKKSADDAEIVFLATVSEDKNLKITPLSALSYETAYRLEIGIDAVSWKYNGDAKLSEPYSFSFTTRIEDDQVEDAVTFKDDKLEAAIREIIDKPDGPLTKSDLLDLERLDLLEKDITSLAGLEQAENLWVLDLTNNRVDDLSSLENLLSLKTLYLHENDLVDIAKLSGLVNLEDLGLSGNEIEDISPLSNLVKLEVLDLAGNHITDIGPLANLGELQRLLLCENDLSDISPVSNLTGLKWLFFACNRVSDIEALENLGSLERLVFNDNSVNDLSALIDNQGLGDKDRVDIKNNDLNLSLDHKDLKDIETLEGRGVQVEYIPQPLYGISGTVEDEDGAGLAGVELTFSGDHDVVETAGDGTWVKNNLSGEITVTPQAADFGFSPASEKVDNFNREVNFTRLVINNTLTGTLTIEHTWPAVSFDQNRLENDLPGVSSFDDSYHFIEEDKEPFSRDLKEEKETGQVIISFAPAATDNAKKRFVDDLEAQVVEKNKTLDAYLLEIPQKSRHMGLYTTLRSSLVDYIEPNYTAYAHFRVPNDTYYGEQWHYPQIRLPRAWADTTGNRSTRVAVLDSGIDAGHPDLSDTVDVASGYNFVDLNQNTGDLFGHGTHVAGIIGAATNNNQGVAGTMWQVEIIPVKVLSDSGSGRYWDIAQGIYYAAGLLDNPSLDDPAQVINISVGGDKPSKTVETALKAAKGAGLIIVASSGNSNEDEVRYPARYPETIAVGAVNYNNGNEPQRAAYSNYGQDLDLVAPGGDSGGGILSTLAHSNDIIYGYRAGTSMAAPHVSGVVGLMLSAGIDPSDVRAVLHRTSFDLGSTGFDPFYGYGLINAYWAVNAVDEVKIIIGERQDDVFDKVYERKVALQDSQFEFMDVPAGTYQVYGWIDVRGTGTLDPGDYLAEAGEIDFSAAGNFTVELVLREFEGTD